MLNPTIFRITLVVIFLFSSVLAAPSQSIKIVGGNQANPKQFPYHIELTWWGNYYCGGAIIAPNWIITAAHCAIQESISYAAVANQYNVLIPEGNEQIRRVSKVFQHPDYTHGEYLNDIALMKLITPYEFNDGVQPVAIAEANLTLPEGTMVSITGWGALSENGLSSQYLRWVDIPTVQREVCREAYAAYGLGVADSMMCAGLLQEGGKDSCSGDSGGPVTAQDGEGNRILVGITSWAIGCARPGLPGVNSDVSYFYEWIAQTMEEN